MLTRSLSALCCLTVWIVTASVSAESNALGCPMIKCAVSDSCTNQQTTYFLVNGLKCRGCPICTDIILGKRDVIPIDLGHLIMCPMVDCAFPGPCTQFKQTYFTFQGRKCQGCPVCENSELPKRQIDLVNGIPIFPNHCPNILCARPSPCKVPYKVSTLTFANRTCTGCSYCPVGQEEVKREVISNEQLKVCPVTRCMNPGPCDEAYQMSFFDMSGIKCPMCPFCPKKGIKTERDVIGNPGIIHVQICPIPMCANPGPCDHAYNISYMTIGDKKCPMCEYCAKDKRDVVSEPIAFKCPRLPCPLPPCSDPQPTTYDFHGHICEGCPVCSKQNIILKS